MAGSSSSPASPLTLAVVGISHHTAPIEVRERFARTPSETRRILIEATTVAGAREAVLLTTCNRTEFYLLLPGSADPREIAIPPLAAGAGMNAAEASGHFYCRLDRDAARHLFRVASSLDSMILGEAQIQGQVRDAYEQAAEVGEPQVVGPVLSRLFQSALAVGGRVRSETALGTGAASVPSAAVELARKIFGPLRGRRAMVLGAGEMSELTLECLRGEGVKGMIVANRTESRAAEVAARVGGTAVGMEELGSVLASVDIIATATASPAPVLTREVVLRALPNGPLRPLFIIDMALPRDVDPAVGDIDNVFLYDIDDLQHIVTSNLERRQSEIAASEAIVAAAVEEFVSWRASLAVVPVIQALRGSVEAVRRSEVERALAKLPHLSEKDREAVDVLTRQLLNKVLHAPTVKLREAASNGRGVSVLDAARYLFELQAAGAAADGGAPESGEAEEGGEVAGSQEEPIVPEAATQTGADGR